MATNQTDGLIRSYSSLADHADQPQVIITFGVFPLHVTYIVVNVSVIR